MGPMYYLHCRIRFLQSEFNILTICLCCFYFPVLSFFYLHLHLKHHECFTKCIPNVCLLFILWCRVCMRAYCSDKYNGFCKVNQKFPVFKINNSRSVLIGNRNKLNWNGLWRWKRSMRFKQINANANRHFNQHRVECFGIRHSSVQWIRSKNNV